MTSRSPIIPSHRTSKAVKLSDTSVDNIKLWVSPKLSGPTSVKILVDQKHVVSRGPTPSSFVFIFLQRKFMQSFPFSSPSPPLWSFLSILFFPCSFLPPSHSLLPHAGYFLLFSVCAVFSHRPGQVSWFRRLPVVPPALAPPVASTTRLFLKDQI